MNHETAESDYLKDLKKWQASNHPILANSQPEELFEPKFAERYRSLYSDLLYRLIDTHGTLRSLYTLRDFPFDYIYGIFPEFWRLVFANFSGMACVLLHGLLNDNKKNLTLNNFYEEIKIAQWIDSKKLDLFEQTFTERDFDNTTKNIRERVTKLRHTEFAHRSKKLAQDKDRHSLTTVTLDELQCLFDATHALFGALSFGSGHVTFAGDFTPGTIGGKPTRTSLDELLDSVLRDSDFVNEPERESDCWSDSRPYRDKEYLRIMNQCRRRINLPEA